MADTPEMFGPTRGFSEMADSMEPCKMLWGRPLLPWQRHLRWAQSLVAYRLVRVLAFSVCVCFPGGTGTGETTHKNPQLRRISLFSAKNVTNEPSWGRARLTVALQVPEVSPRQMPGSAYSVFHKLLSQLISLNSWLSTG